MLNFDRSTVKHACQNIQCDCHQWLSHGFRVYQIRFRPGPGSAPDPTGGAYSAPSGPLAGLKGPTSKGEDGRGRGRKEWEGRGEEGRGREGERRGKGEEKEGRVASLSQIPGSAPCCPYIQ